MQTALEIAENKYANSTNDRQRALLSLLREDDGLGPHQIGDTLLLPLTQCREPEELGVIQKLLELTNIPQRLTDKRAPQARRRNRTLNLVRIAMGMELQGKQIKGPIQVVSVNKIYVGANNCVLAITLIKPNTNPYGFFSHLKAAAFLCGLY